MLFFFENRSYLQAFFNHMQAFTNTAEQMRTKIYNKSTNNFSL